MTTRLRDPSARAITGDDRGLPGCGGQGLRYAHEAVLVQRSRAAGQTTGSRVDVCRLAGVQLGGSLGGKTLSACARERWRELLEVSVLAVQRLSGPYGDRLVWDGKEKVYGSIP
jgi:hypothetical protein